MPRDTYIIIRIDHVLVPATVAYVGHGDTPYDLNLRFTVWRDSATRYGGKAYAVREAKRLARTFTGHRFKVSGYHGRRVVFDSLGWKARAYRRKEGVQV